MNGVREMVRVVLPTQFGEFGVVAFEVHGGFDSVCLGFREPD